LCQGQVKHCATFDVQYTGNMIRAILDYAARYKFYICMHMYVCMYVGEWRGAGDGWPPFQIPEYATV